MSKIEKVEAYKCIQGLLHDTKKQAVLASCRREFQTCIELDSFLHDGSIVKAITNREQLKKILDKYSVLLKECEEE